MAVVENSVKSAPQFVHFFAMSGDKALHLEQVCTPGLQFSLNSNAIDPTFKEHQTLV
jgi:hypothetical protein